MSSSGDVRRQRVHVVGFDPDRGHRCGVAHQRGAGASAAIQPGHVHHVCGGRGGVLRRDWARLAVAGQHGTAHAGMHWYSSTFVRYSCAFLRSVCSSSFALLSSSAMHVLLADLQQWFSFNRSSSIVVFFLAP